MSKVAFAVAGTETHRGGGGVLPLPITCIQPSPENDQLYKPVDPSDPDIIALAASIKKNGVLEPLVVSEDCYILSGHRRFAACKLAGLAKVPCRIVRILRSEEPDRFVRLLREFNRQRNKSFAEKVREEAISINPRDAYQRLLSERARASVLSVDRIELDDRKPRARISEAKRPMLDAVIEALDELREYWPVSDRRLHYVLAQNKKPLRHASKPDSIYVNDSKSYDDLTDLLTRARIEGYIAWEAIGDETRPVTTWNTWRDPQQFIRSQFENLLRGYWRDRMQSQPNHVEVVAEKNTVAPIAESICGRYCIPMTSGRGFCSLPPRKDMLTRFQRSGKDKLVVLILSDLDPPGEIIAESFARSMRDDFDVDEERLVAVKVALNFSQVEQFGLEAGLAVKREGNNWQRYVERYGEQVWELEALAPEQIQELLDEAIRSVIDVDAYNHEVEAEIADAADLEATREAIRRALPDIDFGD